MQATRLYTILLASFFVSATADSLTAQTIIHVPLYTFDGESESDFFGDSVNGVGDVNGDGLADVIVGASSNDENGSNSGSARVFSGSDGSVLHNFLGDEPADGFGGSVSGAGDVNGDGTPDLIVGATGDSGGSARVLSGSDGSVLHNFVADGSSDLFGISVSGAGDINGDGMADLIVGASSGVVSNGYARVLSGRDGSVLYNFVGDGRDDLFGRSVSGAGDINGDGTPDLIIGVPFEDNNGFGSGSARVFSGSDGSVLHNFDGDSKNDNLGVSVSGAGDVNSDGMADIIVGAYLDDGGRARVLSGKDGSVLYNFDRDGGGGQFGWSVSNTGDVNKDGIEDFIVGAPRAETGLFFFSGSVRVLSGKDGSVLYDFNGDDDGDEFGSSVSGAGDVNGDGVADFIVGAPSGGANDGGYARVFVSQILGDCNQDGAVNFLDISPFIAILSAGDFLGQADINQDGVVDFLDIAPFIALLTS